MIVYSEWAAIWKEMFGVESYQLILGIGEARYRKLGHEDE
jgi:hypothetical protein